MSSRADLAPSATLNSVSLLGRSAGILAVFATIALSSSSALAGAFGGFAQDGNSYLSGQDKVCKPVKDKADSPNCSKASASTIARAGFDKGIAERGTKARFTAVAEGTVVRLRRAGDDTAIAEWDAMSSVSKITAVHATKKARLVAVEFEVRFGGRASEDVIVFELAGSEASAGADVGGHGATVGTGAATGAIKPTLKPAKPSADDKRLRAAVTNANKLLRRKKWKNALKAYRAALVIDDNDPQAQFGVAAALASLGKKAEATAALEVLAKSKHPDAPVWLVEARTASYFAKLRSDRAYRLAVGLDGDPNRQRTAYERAMGFGGHWEQAEITCEQPRVNLKLLRKGRKFTLVIRSKCGGYTDTTRLKGVWQASKVSELALTFPNKRGPDDTMSCEIERCTDGSGEDCVRCNPEEDLEFLLRVVRR
jgi:hypothetical protein